MSGRLTDEQVKTLFLAQMTSGPRPGDHWVHHRGGRYLIVCRSLRESDHEPLVTYASMDTLVSWTRPLSEFLGPVGPEGYPPRFSKESP